MRLFRHPRWQHLDYRVKVATTQENKPPTQGTRQWTFTTPRWRCGSILLPSRSPSPQGEETSGDSSFAYKSVGNHMDDVIGLSQTTGLPGEWGACNLTYSKHCFHRYSPARVLARRSTHHRVPNPWKLTTEMKCKDFSIFAYFYTHFSIFV